MKLKQSPFGSIHNQDVDLYSLSNDNGMEVNIMTFGATITSIKIPDEQGKPQCITCGFDSLEAYFADAYKANAPYFGCTVGRYSSQIKDAKFALNGVDYQLSDNCGPNNLHGGTVGFDKRIWKAQEIKDRGMVGVQFTLHSQDMEEGYPGNVDVTVKMVLTDSNHLQITYKANTDKATPLSMTNHTYWNLTGFTQNVEQHQVMVDTNTKLELDDTGAATGKVLDVSGQTDDLRKGKVVADVQKSMGDGFEHFYVFDNEDLLLNKVAEIKAPTGKRKLEVFTKEPCMLFYTAKYMSDELQRNENEKYGKYRAFACESHRWPNGPNIAGSPKSITTPNEPFESTTVFKLSW